MQAHEHDLLRAVEDAHWWHRTLRAQVLRVLPPHARVLDAGCGTGGMLSVLHDHDAHGIDASPSAIQHCQQRDDHVQPGVLGAEISSYAVHDIAQAVKSVLADMDVVFLAPAIRRKLPKWRKY